MTAQKTDPPENPDKATPPTSIQPGGDSPPGLDSLPVDDLSGSAGDLTASIDNNVAVAQKVSPASKPKPSDTGWGKEPIANFITDESGKIQFNKNGTPKRRGGRPKKPKPGTTLADGSTYGVASEGGETKAGPSGGGGASRVVLPGQPEGVAEPVKPDTSVEGGPEAGRVLSKLLFGWAVRRGGDKWRPDDDERKLIDDAASASLNGKRLPWPLVLLVGLAAYVAARIELKKKPKESSDGGDSSVRNGADAERKDPAGPEAGVPSGIGW